MNKKIITILLIIFITILWGYQQIDFSSTSTVSNEDISSIYNKTDTVTSNEHISKEDIILPSEDVVYLPLIINSLLDVEIKELYVSQSNSSNWGENLIDTPLSNDISLKLELPIIDVNSLTWDFLLVDVDGNEIVLPQIDFSSATLTDTNIFIKCNDDHEYFYSFL